MREDEIVELLDKNEVLTKINLKDVFEHDVNNSDILNKIKDREEWVKFLHHELTKKVDHVTLDTFNKPSRQKNDAYKASGNPFNDMYGLLNQSDYDRYDILQASLYVKLICDEIGVIYNLNAYEAIYDYAFRNNFANNDNKSIDDDYLNHFMNEKCLKVIVEIDDLEQGYKDIPLKLSINDLINLSSKNYDQTNEFLFSIKEKNIWLKHGDEDNPILKNSSNALKANDDKNQEERNIFADGTISNIKIVLNDELDLRFEESDYIEKDIVWFNTLDKEYQQKIKTKNKIK